jgi:hypothetical protein
MKLSFIAVILQNVPAKSTAEKGGQLFFFRLQSLGKTTGKGC